MNGNAFLLLHSPMPCSGADTSMTACLYLQYLHAMHNDAETGFVEREPPYAQMQACLGSHQRLQETLFILKNAGFLRTKAGDIYQVRLWACQS